MSRLPSWPSASATSSISDQRWLPALKAAKAGGFAKRFTRRDLWHTHVGWLIAVGVPLPNIQQRLGA